MFTPTQAQLDYINAAILPNWVMGDLSSLKTVQRDAAAKRIEKASKMATQILDQFEVFYDTLVSRKPMLSGYNQSQRMTFERQVSDVLWHAPTIRMGATVEVISLRAAGSDVNLTKDHILGRKYVGCKAVAMMEAGVDDLDLYFDLFVEGLKVILCTQKQNLMIAKYQGNTIDPYLAAASDGHDVRYIIEDIAYMTPKRVQYFNDCIANNNIPTFNTTKDVLNWDILTKVETI